MAKSDLEITVTLDTKWLWLLLAIARVLRFLIGVDRTLVFIGWLAPKMLKVRVGK